MLNAHFLTHGDAKRIDDLAGIGVQVFEHLAIVGEQTEQRVGQHM